MFPIFAMKCGNEIIAYASLGMLLLRQVHFYPGLIFFTSCCPNHTFSTCGFQCEESQGTSGLVLRLNVFESV